MTNVAHPDFWKADKPKKFTMISKEDVQKGVWHCNSPKEERQLKISFEEMGKIFDELTEKIIENLANKEIEEARRLKGQLDQAFKNNGWTHDEFDAVLDVRIEAKYPGYLQPSIRCKPFVLLRGLKEGNVFITSNVFGVDPTKIGEEIVYKIIGYGGGSN